MSLKYIRDYYKVPAYRGARVLFADSGGCRFYGRITSAKGQYLRIIVDDRIPGYRGRMLLHPTWNVDYITADKTEGA